MRAIVAALFALAFVTDVVRGSACTDPIERQVRFSRGSACWHFTGQGLRSSEISRLGKESRPAQPERIESFTASSGHHGNYQ